GLVEDNIFDSLFLPECRKDSFRLKYDATDWYANPLDFGAHDVEITARSKDKTLDSENIVFVINPPEVTGNVPPSVLIDKAFSIGLGFDYIFDRADFKVYVDNYLLKEGSCVQQYDCMTKYDTIGYTSSKWEENPLNKGKHTVTIKTYHKDNLVGEKKYVFYVSDKTPYDSLTVDIPSNVRAGTPFDVKVTLREVAYADNDRNMQVNITAFMEGTAPKEIYSGSKTVDVLNAGDDVEYRISSADFKKVGDGKSNYFEDICGEVNFKVFVGGDMEARETTKKTSVEGGTIELTLNPAPTVLNKDVTLTAKDEDGGLPLDSTKIRLMSGNNILASGETDVLGKYIMQPRDYATEIGDAFFLATKYGFCRQIKSLGLSNRLVITTTPTFPKANEQFKINVRQENGGIPSTITVDIDYNGLVKDTDEEGSVKATISQVGKYAIHAGGKDTPYAPADALVEITGEIATECRTNSDCMPLIKKPHYCMWNTIYQDKEWGICVNPGTANSRCTTERSTTVVRVCGENTYCNNGECAIKTSSQGGEETEDVEGGGSSHETLVEKVKDILTGSNQRNDNTTKISEITVDALEQDAKPEEVTSIWKIIVGGMILLLIAVIIATVFLIWLHRRRNLRKQGRIWGQTTSKLNVTQKQSIKERIIGGIDEIKKFNAREYLQKVKENIKEFNLREFLRSMWEDFRKFNVLEFMQEAKEGLLDVVDDIREAINIRIITDAIRSWGRDLHSAPRGLAPHASKTSNVEIKYNHSSSKNEPSALSHIKRKDSA
ncbi:MAG: hypothetical protein KKD39_01530, partial [Candidatus Altiarchaeota archaeon]|nr:hypothetical protein [Candidatus Altiarchaeota archaeon]